jgi:hypothetical protein
MMDKAVTRKRRTCVLCDEPGTFITPDGLYCDEHALAVAAEEGEGEEWLPLRVEQPDSASPPDPGRAGE